MGHMIIKPDKDTDLYLIWSSVVEAPIFVGTLAEIVWKLLPAEERQRIHNADAYGSSGYPPFDCNWENKGEIFMQRGWLPRENMLELAQRLHARPDEDVDVTDLLKPFGDDEEVRPA